MRILGSVIVDGNNPAVFHIERGVPGEQRRGVSVLSYS